MHDDCKFDIEDAARLGMNRMRIHVLRSLSRSFAGYNSHCAVCSQPQPHRNSFPGLYFRCLTGHEASSAFLLPEARNDPAAGSSPQLPPTHSLPIQPFPTVVFDSPSTHQQSVGAPPFAEVQEAAATLTPLTVSTAFPSPAPIDTLTGHYFGGPECPVLSPTVPSVPSLLGSGYATAEGSPDLGIEPYLHPDIAFDPTKPFDWTVLAEVALPPQAEPSLITERDGEGPPGQYEGPESFEFVSPPSITASNGQEITMSRRTLGGPIFHLTRLLIVH